YQRTAPTVAALMALYILCIYRRHFQLSNLSVYIQMYYPLSALPEGEYQKVMALYLVWVVLMVFLALVALQLLVIALFYFSLAFISFLFFFVFIIFVLILVLVFFIAILSHFKSLLFKM